MTIAQRLYCLIGAFALALATLGGAGMYQLQKVYDAANFANINTVPSLLVLDQVHDNLSHMRVNVWQHLALTDAAQVADKGKTVALREAALMRALERYEREDIAGDRDRALLAADRSALAAYKELITKVLALSEAGRKEEARELQMQQQDVIVRIDEAVAAHRAYNEGLGKQGAEDGHAILRTSQWAAAAIVVLAIAGATGMGLLLARRIVRSLHAAMSVARSVAAGDLTRDIAVQSNDEVGQLMASLREMNDNLVGIVSQVRHGTDTIALASTEIASGNMDLSGRTEQQAGSLEETASSMEELTSTVKQNSESARQASSLASAASEVAQSGGAIVSQVVDKMTAISESSRKIGDIISVIDGIAFQTNILALNAAVEAARAGEQGRGFAVVATEVRSLAQRSASAAKEIKVLIEDSVGHVDAGGKLVQDAGTAMQDIVESVGRVTAVVNEISMASHEQAAGIEQVNQAIIEMDGTTQQNAALVEQAAAAASSLQDQASDLAQVVSVFKLHATSGQRSVTSTPALARPAVAAPPRTALASAPRKQAAAPRQADTFASDWEEF